MSIRSILQALSIGEMDVAQAEAAIVDRCPKGGDAKQGSTRSARARVRRTSPNPSQDHPMTYNPTDDELVAKVARALSIPQHHTTWDLLSDMEKDLFHQQAAWAIKATNVLAIDRDREKFLWQVRDTCSRAEKAEATLIEYRQQVQDLKGEVAQWQLACGEARNALDRIIGTCRATLTKESRV